ncbi:hypothetical protein FisN_10Hh332, partial [Fistulifera solaris]
LDRVWIL